MPRPLDTGRLSKFEPKRPQEPAAGQGRGPEGRVEPSAGVPESNPHLVTEAASRWRSRAPVVDGQISIKAPLDTLERFKQMCADDRRTYGAMLEILMDRFEGKS